MASDFIEFIKKVADVPIEQEHKFSALVTKTKVQKGETYIRAGRFPTSIAYIKNGLFRYFYLSNKGEEFTKGFFTENSILSSYSAILENRASYFSIEALVDSTLEIIDYQKFQKLFAEHHCWNNFLVAMLQKAFIAKEEREREFLLLNAEERYKSFLIRYPGLENRVKQNIIASYLGIKPESLSRIRKNYPALT